MSEELYAKKAPLKDDRVKEFAYKDSILTEKMYTENAVTVDLNTERNKLIENNTQLKTIKDTQIDKNALKADSEYKSVTAIKLEGKGSIEDFQRVEFEAASKVGTVTEEAAADIIKEKAKFEKEVLEKEMTKTSTYFEDSFRLMASTFRVRLLFDRSISDDAQKALDNKIQKKKNLIDSVLTKFSRIASFSDRLRKAKSDSLKELPAPVQKTDKKYADL